MKTASEAIKFITKFCYLDLGILKGIPGQIPKAFPGGTLSTLVQTSGESVIGIWNLGVIPEGFTGSIL